MNDSQQRAWLCRAYDRTLRPWLEWLFRYPLLALVTAVLLIIITETPTGLGIELLFWHGSDWVKFFAGWALAGLAGELCYTGYLLDADEEWMTSGEEKVIRSRRRWYLVFTYFPLMGLVVWIAALDFSARQAVVWGAAMGTFTNCCLAWLMSHVFSLNYSEQFEKRMRENRPWLKRLLKIPDRRELVQLHLMALAYFIFIGVLYLLFVVMPTRWCETVPSLLSPAVALSLLLAVVVALYGRVLFWFQKRHFGVFVLLGLLLVVLVGLPSYPRRFAGLHSGEFNYYVAENRVKLADIEDPAQPNDALVDNLESLKAWRQELGAGAKPKLVLVTASGGGIRASLWTTVVLAKLEEEIPAFPRHVRVITGASGGMLGAGYWVASMTPGQTRTTNQLEKLVEDASKESLSDMGRTMVVRDIPLLGYNTFDRGWALERAWTNNMGEVMGEPLAGLADDEAAGKRPSLIFSPMIVEDGRPLLISNLDLSGMLENRGSRIGVKGVEGDSVYSLAAAQFYNLFPKVRGRFPLSTAIRISASFPYVSPEAVLPTEPPRRLIDAGTYDNYGVYVAAVWLNHVFRSQRQWLADNVSGIIVVQIRDNDTEVDRKQLVAQGEDGPSLLERGAHWLSTPLEAVFSARRSTMSLRNDDQLQNLSKAINGELGSDYFKTMVFELTEDVSLSWYLTKREIALVKGSIDADVNRPLIGELKKELPSQ